MENNFNNRDFERFVKQNADQYRMFPSEKVWEGVHDALHTRRRWYGIGFALLLLTSAIVTLIMVSTGGKDRTVAAAVKTSPVKDKNAAARTVAGSDKTGPVALSPGNDPFIISPERIARPAYNISSAETVTDLTTVTADDRMTDAALVNTPVTTQVHNDLNPSVAPSSKPVVNPAVTFTDPLAIKVAGTRAPAAMNQDIAKTEVKTVNPPATVSAKADDKDELNLPQIPERKVKAVAKATKKKLGWQLYITPTVSYRTLSENTAFISQTRYNSIISGTGAGASYYSTDVNMMVNHKPDLGFQLGLRTSYPLSKWFSLTGGLQLSVSKYDIRAYEHPAEIATIALLDRSVNTVSNLRNTNGYKESWLHNFYFSASLPIGAELKLSDGSRNYFGIAGTLQPTYVLDNRAYLISTDYKNYAEMPSLTRRWNMNSSLEIFSAHKTGKVNWRIGPQVRYQLMSSFSKNYPIKEHLFDFGLKLGIQLK